MATSVEARLRKRIERLEGRVESVVWRDDRWERRHIKSLTRAVHGERGLANRAERLQAADAVQQQRIGALEQELARLRDKTSATSWLSYALAALVVVTIAILLWRRRRRDSDRKSSSDVDALIFGPAHMDLEIAGERGSSDVRG